MAEPDFDIPADTFTYTPDFLPAALTRRAWEGLCAAAETVPWKVKQIFVGGRACRQNRMSAYYASDAGANYRFSGVDNEGAPLKDAPAVLREIWDLVAAHAAADGHRVNYVLMNLYRDGSDSIGEHRDDERDLDGPVYSVSINESGEPDQRRFFDIMNGQHVVENGKKRRQKRRIACDDGSLMTMKGQFQRLFTHCVPTQKRVTMGRINLTFRTVKVADA